MGTLLGPNGYPISSKSLNSNYRKAAPPVLGEAFGDWAGRDIEYFTLPGGAAIQVDVSKLTLANFRQMSHHYQVNSSLSVLMFMLHQLDWHIEAGGKTRIEDHVSENLSNIWTRLVRAMSQAFWAGYSPNVLQWENDTNGRTVQLTKIKDIVPEEASVHWKKVEGKPGEGAPTGASTPKIKVFDGINIFGMPGHVPVGNSYWYPLLMENGNYGGRKLLKAAFQPWFFSTLMHLFSNRYFERFGEPVPVGRAPLEESVNVPGRQSPLAANDYMAGLLQSLRSRSVVVMPSDRALDQSGNPTDKYDYDIEYLESQMRGADFERYMTRLDEEISLALFTPLLLMRTADVGSYNLGVGHMQMYLWQLNAIAGDWAEYINKYILASMVNYNFGPTAPRPKIVFHKMGKTQAETNRAIVQSLISNGKIKVDLTELGQAIGLSLNEIEELKEPSAEKEPSADIQTDEDNESTGETPRVVRDDNPTSVVDKITQRIRPQVEKAFRNGSFGKDFSPDFGYGSYFNSVDFSRLKSWNDDLMTAEFDTPAEYLSYFECGAKDILGGANDTA